MKFHFCLPVLAIVLLLAGMGNTAWAIAVGEVDNFSVDLEAWHQGHAAVGSIGATRATTGGPAGAGDAFLHVQSDAVSSNGKIVVFNQTQWAGNYSIAGVTTIGMAANNLGATDLKLRVALGTGTNASSGSWYCSTAGVDLPAGSGWTLVQFPLAAGGMSLVGGSATYSTVLGGVVTVRLLHSGNTPDNNGLPIVATLGIDNIMALSAPVNVGDYNNNGVVDAADYVVWRDKLSTSTVLPNDSTPGSVTSADFTVWRANFGDLLGSGSAAVASVPEPATCIVLAQIACVIIFCSTRRRIAPRTKYFVFV